MIDFRLPYFYNLAAAAILGMFLSARLERIVRNPIEDPAFYLTAFLTLLPAGTAVAWFVGGYRQKRDLTVRELLFIFVAVQILTALIPAFLR